MAALTPFDLNLRHLEGAHAVVSLGGVTSAAAAVNLSQPALTQAMTKLETQIERRLFDRHPGGARPTEAGIILAARVHRVLTLLTEAARQARRGLSLAPLGPVARHLG